MIDTHCHIDGKEFDEDRAKLIERAKNIGITKLIIPAIEPNRFEKLWQVVNSDDMIYCGFGVHPHNASEYNEDVEKLIIDKLNEKKVVAVGEIGLDYYYDFVPKDIQKQVFRRQLEIAKQYDKPVIVHNRETDNDILEIIKSVQSENSQNDLKGVLHCFSSDLEVLKQALDLGFLVSFTGNVTFKKSTLDEIVKYVPNDKFMIETDSPYITPVPYRGKRNEPSYVKYVAEKIAEIKNESIENIINYTSENAMKLFKLSLILIITSILNLSFNTNELLAQIQVQNQKATVNQTIEIEETEEEDEYIEEEDENPYKKNLGVGFFVGPNTIVVTEFYPVGKGPQGGDEFDRTYEGFAFFGGSLQYSPLDYLILETSYYASKNINPTIGFESVRKPDYYNGLEVTSLWIANPSKRINFFGGIGGTFLMNNLNGVSSTAVGMNFSIGFMGNIKFEGLGLLNLVAQWRLNPQFGRQDISVLDPNRKINSEDPAEKYKTIDIQATQFFSMPRFSLVWYPEF